MKNPTTRAPSPEAIIPVVKMVHLKTFESVPDLVRVPEPGACSVCKRREFMWNVLVIGFLLMECFASSLVKTGLAIGRANCPAIGRHNNIGAHGIGGFGVLNWLAFGVKFFPKSES